MSSRHILICTKNRAIYGRRYAENAADVADTRWLVAAAARGGRYAAGAANLQRLRQANADEPASDG